MSQSSGPSPDDNTTTTATTTTNDTTPPSLSIALGSSPPLEAGLSNLSLVSQPGGSLPGSVGLLPTTSAHLLGHLSSANRQRTSSDGASVGSSSMSLDDGLPAPPTSVGASNAAAAAAAARSRAHRSNTARRGDLPITAAASASGATAGSSVVGGAAPVPLAEAVRRAANDDDDDDDDDAEALQRRLGPVSLTADNLQRVPDADEVAPGIRLPRENVDDDATTESGHRGGADDEDDNNASARGDDDDDDDDDAVRLHDNTVGHFGPGGVAVAGVPPELDPRTSKFRPPSPGAASVFSVAVQAPGSPKQSALDVAEPYSPSPAALDTPPAGGSTSGILFATPAGSSIRDSRRFSSGIYSGAQSVSGATAGSSRPPSIRASSPPPLTSSATAAAAAASADSPAPPSQSSGTRFAPPPFLATPSPPPHPTYGSSSGAGPGPSGLSRTIVSLAPSEAGSSSSQASNSLPAASRQADEMVIERQRMREREAMGGEAGVGGILSRPPPSFILPPEISSLRDERGGNLTASRAGSTAATVGTSSPTPSLSGLSEYPDGAAPPSRRGSVQSTETLPTAPAPDVDVDSRTTEDGSVRGAGGVSTSGAAGRRSPMEDDDDDDEDRRMADNGSQGADVDEDEAEGDGASGSGSKSGGTSSRRGAFIVVEGLDRAGKTTQVQRLVEELQATAIKFPDRTTGTGSMIDSYLTQGTDLDDKAIHLLFSANRWEKSHWIVAQLRAGQTIVCDRYAFSGIAYSVAKGLDYEWCRTPDIGLPLPDLTIFLDVAADIAASRGGYGAERYEKESLQRRVRDVFAKVEEDVKGHGGEWKNVDAGRDVESVAFEVKEAAKVAVGIVREGRGAPIGRLFC